MNIFAIVIHVETGKSVRGESLIALLSVRMTDEKERFISRKMRMFL